MNNSQKSIALAVSGAFALSIATASVHAAEDPFSAKSLATGYQVAEHHEKKMKDGKCGTGKCGASKKAAKEKAKEGQCSAEKMKDGACSAEMRKSAVKEHESQSGKEKDQESKNK